MIFKTVTWTEIVDGTPRYYAALKRGRRVIQTCSSDDEKVTGQLAQLMLNVVRAMQKELQFEVEGVER